VDEHSVEVKPKVTHEVTVLRADGTAETVAQEVLSPEKAEAILATFRRAAPEMVAEAEENARRAKAERLKDAQEEATKNG
jgi:class 3 adenylate cyclase